jgi:hypothetical protein
MHTRYAHVNSLRPTSVEPLPEGARQDLVQTGTAGGLEAQLEQGQRELRPAEQALDDVVRVVGHQFDARFAFREWLEDGLVGGKALEDPLTEGAHSGEHVEAYVAWRQQL